jgi:hypothetical protein
MSPIVKILLFMFSCVLTNNYIFSRFLGVCPFLGVSGKWKPRWHGPCGNVRHVAREPVHVFCVLLHSRQTGLNT